MTWYFPERDDEGNEESYEDCFDRLMFEAESKEPSEDDEDAEDAKTHPRRRIDWRVLIESLKPGDRGKRHTYRRRRASFPARTQFSHRRSVVNAWRWLEEHRSEILAAAPRCEGLYVDIVLRADSFPPALRTLPSGAPSNRAERTC